MLALGVVRGGSGNLAAQGGAALTGAVSSKEEGKMEGVLVTARREGANFTVSVVSDAQGKYSFPRTHVSPGKYTLMMRAIGYDLVAPGPQDVTAAKTANVDLALQKTKDLAAQMTSLELANSMPGPDLMKDKLVHQLLSCNYCHTYNRIVKSKHNAEEFVAAMERMRRYYPDGAASSRDGRGRAVPWSPEYQKQFTADPNWGFSSPFEGEMTGVPKKELAIYLATANLSEGRTQLPYELKTLPRPKGKSTRVIITQWDQPDKGTVSHDADVDSKGNLWYTDESAQKIGKLDPKTNVITEYPMPPVNKGPGNMFRVENGEVVTTGKIQGYMYTEKTYLNFTMRFDFRHVPPEDWDPAGDYFDGNSGYLLFVTEHGVWPKGIEIQGNHMGPLSALGMDTTIKATNDAAATARVKKTAGQWQTAEIVSKDGQVKCYLNGTLVTTVTEHEFKAPGHIAFQSEGAELHWRNIRIKEE